MALWQDVRYAARLLVKDRWFTIVAAVALALGIGVNATVFTFVNAVLLRGLPFENPDRIMWVGTRRRAARRTRALVDSRLRGLALAGETRRPSRALGQGFAFNISEPGASRIAFPASTSRGTSSRRSASVRSSAGTSSADDDKPGAPPVVIISHSLWQSRYGGDPNVIGRTVTVNAFMPTIIGVMPPDLTFPANNHLWVPLVHMPPGVKPLNRDARQFQVARPAQGRRHAGSG